MTTMIAYCGLKCEECPAYLATQEDDVEQLKALATEWSTDDYPFTLADMRCDGCTTTERVFKWCQDCPIRACCIAKGFANCAHCADLPCDKLAQGPTERVDRLQEIRRTLNA